MLKKGLISKIVSNLYTVNVKNKSYEVRLRGKFRHENITPLVGDRVMFNSEEKIIEEILPRTNESIRPRVANINNVLIISSLTEPKLSFTMLDRLILIYESLNIKPVLIFTKKDLLNKEEFNKLKKQIDYYKKISYKVFYNNQLLRIKLFLKNKTVFLSGNSGVGKSTLINKLDKTKNLETKEISSFLQRGVHTTRHVELHKISNFYIVDTPGFSNVDINLKPSEIKKYFKEFNNTNCEYQDCNHIEEDCEVKKQVLTNKMLQSRYNSYKKFYMEAYENSSKLYK